MPEWLSRGLQTRSGRWLWGLLFALLLSQVYPSEVLGGRFPWWEIWLAAMACSEAGRYRGPVLALSTLVLWVVTPDWFPSRWLSELAAREGTAALPLAPLRYSMSALVVALGSGLMVLRFRSLAAQLGLFVGLVLLAESLTATPRLLVYTFLWAWSGCFWYLAYALRDGGRWWFRLGSIHPYFGGSWLPVGLGPAYLSRHQAQSPEQLAQCQFKAMKLLVHCAFLGLVQKGFLWAHDQAQVPLFEQLLPAQLEGQLVYSRTTCWLSLVASFFEMVVAAALTGNLVVACARLGGFALLQHTYRPLQARSIADFWNRIAYYFKQVMVDFFFYPTFLALRGRPRALRTALAVFMAAGLGNLCFHFRQLLPLISRRGLVPTLWGMQTYLFYCLLLSSGIALSQASGQGPQRGWQRLLTFLRIVAFYSLLEVFDELYSPQSLLSHLLFLGYLFGLPGEFAGSPNFMVF